MTQNTFIDVKTVEYEKQIKIIIKRDKLHKYEINTMNWCFSSCITNIIIGINLVCLL